jgi:UDP-N-acetyl-D-mannosaminuronate dehydrogenase
MKDMKTKERFVELRGQGLPLLLDFSEAGFPALGFDIDPQKVDLLNEGCYCTR